MANKINKVDKQELGKIGNAPVVLIQGRNEETGTVCLVLEGEIEPGKAKAPTRYFSKKLAMIALANADKLRAFVADPRFSDPTPAAPAPGNVIQLAAPVAPPANDTTAAEMAELRAMVAQLRSQASGRLSPSAA